MDSKNQNQKPGLYENAETEGVERYLSQVNDLSLDQQLFEKYLGKVFEIRPNIKEIYEATREVDLVSYDKRHIRENKNPVTRGRKHELIDVMYSKVRKLLGSKIADSVAKQLKGNDSVSTTQHSASLGHYVLKLTLQNGLPYFNSENPNLQNVIVLACAGVSFNNSSTPRSLLLHTNKGLDYLPFFGRSADATPVIYHPAYGYGSIEEMLKEVSKIRQENGIGEAQEKLIKSVLEEIYASPHVLSQDLFTDQLAITNFQLFNKIFKTFPGKVPNLVFISQEEIVNDLLLKYHLDNKTTLHNVLFDQAMHQLIEKYFDKVDGAFNLKKAKGTFLFWGYDKEEKNRLQLFKEGNFLVSSDKSFKVELSPGALRKYLEEKRLIPSVMLTFFVLAFYYGLYLTGAYKQSYDLPELLAKYVKMLKAYGDKEGIKATEGLITSNLIVPSSLLYLKKQNGTYLPATALDIITNPEKQSGWAEIFEALKTIPFSEVIVKMFPIIYNRLCPQKEKEEVYTKLSEQDIDKYTKFPTKIPPIVNLSN